MQSEMPSGQIITNEADTVEELAKLAPVRFVQGANSVAIYRLPMPTTKGKRGKVARQNRRFNRRRQRGPLTFLQKMFK